ncbi:hypothetical protein GOP47_0015281 [Adiantum capillus-veneris]|uniref:Uncharacterized protein n=1 Tax=Adiantum capillus-veneris TaxID=13818 RepID=A0A9D4ZD20_ADICA|nr:hypothetical protein GOP47_0015281 [Adiantum capillus-veneris]
MTSVGCTSHRGSTGSTDTVAGCDGDHEEGLIDLIQEGSGEHDDEAVLPGDEQQASCLVCRWVTSRGVRATGLVHTFEIY